MTSFVILGLSMTYLLEVMQADGIVAFKQTFLAPFFLDIILLFLGGFVLSSALHKFQVDEQAARFVLRKTGSSASHLLAGIIIIITAVNSMLLSNTATTAMMLTLGLLGCHGTPDFNTTQCDCILLRHHQCQRDDENRGAHFSRGAAPALYDCPMVVECAWDFPLEKPNRFQFDQERFWPE